MTTGWTWHESAANWQDQMPFETDPALSLAVWRWTLADGRGNDSCLSAGELKRSESMEALARDRFLLHRSRMRQVLASYLECPAGAIRFQYSRLGRPSLDSPRISLDFNLSHSGEYGVLAVSRLGNVGVDIERFRNLPDYLAIARRVWPMDWSADLADTPEKNQQQRFYEYWTRFEACQKAQGGGVFSKIEPADRSIVPFTLAPDCVGHLCLADSRATFPEVSWFRLVDHD